MVSESVKDFTNKILNTLDINTESNSGDSDSQSKDLITYNSLLKELQIQKDKTDKLLKEIKILEYNYL